MASYDESVRSITLNADATLAVFTGAPGLPGSATGANVAGNQYRAVVITGAHQGGLSNANIGTQGAPVGILQNKPQGVGNAATVAIGGVSKVKVSTNIVAGQLVFVAADGTGANTGAANAAIGRAVETSTNAGALVPVLLQLGS